MNLLTGTNSTIPGFSSMPFDIGKAISIVHYFSGRGVVYGLGSKARNLDAPIDETFQFAPGQDCAPKSIDCSGMKRLLLRRCSGENGTGVLCPDGSFTQNEWMASTGFKHDIIPAPFSPDYLQNLNPRYVYDCYCKTGSRGERIGHTWLLVNINGKWWSLESHGGHGPDMRPWDTPILAQIVTDIYPIGMNTPLTP